MLSGREGNENGEKTTMGLISKKKTLLMQGTFFVHFFAVVLHDYNVKLPETSQLHVLRRKCRKFSCSLFFSTAADFHLGGRQYFSFSHRYKLFMFFFQQKYLVCFYLSLQHSVALFLVDLCWSDAYFLFSSFLLFLYFLNFWT